MIKKVILCVDDEKIVLDSIKTQLKNSFGSLYLYESAENAEDALELIDELVKDQYIVLIIVSDWLMPGIKGDEFLIKVHHKYPNIVKVMLTGQADEQAVENAIRNANLHCCLHKPWSEEELIDAIKTGLDQV